MQLGPVHISCTSKDDVPLSRLRFLGLSIFTLVTSGLPEPWRRFGLILRNNDIRGVKGLALLSVSSLF